MSISSPRGHLDLFCQRFGLLQWKTANYGSIHEGWQGKQGRVGRGRYYRWIRGYSGHRGYQIGRKECKRGDAAAEKKENNIFVVPHILHKQIFPNQRKQHSKDILDFRLRRKRINRNKRTPRHPRQQQRDKGVSVAAADARGRLELRRKDILRIIQRHDTAVQLRGQNESALLRQPFWGLTVMQILADFWRTMIIA